MGRELLFVHVGEAGCKMGAAYWQLFCAEHGVDPHSGEAMDAQECHGLRSCLFHQAERGGGSAPPQCVVPRAVWLDTDPDTLHDLARGRALPHHHEWQVVAGGESAGSNACHARYVLWTSVKERATEALRKQAEACDALAGVVLTYSVCGGTGAGIGPHLLTVAESTLGAKAPKVVVAALPSPDMSSGVVVENYNAVMALHEQLSTAQMVVALDNQSLYGKCALLGVGSPSLPDLNHIVAAAVSTLTSALRFHGAQPGLSLDHLVHTTVPFPRCSLVVPALAPLRGAFQARATGARASPSAAMLVASCFDPGAALASCDVRNGRFLGVGVQMRGAVGLRESLDAVRLARSRIQAQCAGVAPDMSWGTVGGTALPVRLPASPLAPTTCEALAVVNTTAVSALLGKMLGKFSKLYAKRAFVHWYYGTGLSEGLFAEAFEDVYASRLQYKELAS